MCPEVCRAVSTIPGHLPEEFLQPRCMSFKGPAISEFVSEVLEATTQQFSSIVNPFVAFECLGDLAIENIVQSLQDVLTGNPVEQACVVLLQQTL